MSKRSFRGALAVVVVTLGLLCAGGVYAATLVLHYPSTRHHGSGKTVEVPIASGWRIAKISAELQKAGVIDSARWFHLYVSLEGSATKIRAGKYELKDDLTPKELLAILKKGVEEPDVSVAIPEGKNLREVFQIFGDAGVADPAELEKIARDPDWLKQEGIDGETVEGYLFPDTYRFKKPTPAKTVLETLVKHHRIVYDELRKKHAKTLAELEEKLHWGDREMVVMASLVEKETGVAGERGKVASVFYNRLLWPSFPSHRLETDPTIRYGCTIPDHKSAACQQWNPAGRLHKPQLEDDDNAYNTYRHAGLPPGPICNPGRASLEAAMAPEHTEYLFFVATTDGSQTIFAKTEEEHDKNVKKYQLSHPQQP